MPNMFVIYATGFFSLSLFQMTAVATPLWGSHLGLSVFLIGVSAACRSVIPLVYSIHIGALIDRFGARRIGILFSGLCASCLVLYPVFRSETGFILLQLVLGLATSTVWLVSLTAIARASRGNASESAWYSFSTSIGNIVGPLVFGFIWTKLGPGSGYVFLSIWAVGLLLSFTLLMKRTDVARPELRVADLVPRASAYLDGWVVLRRSIILFVIICAFLRLGGLTMFEAFYPLLLADLGFSAATIGILFALSNVVSSPSALLAPRFVRLCRSDQLALTISVAILIAAVMVTPLLTSFWALAFFMTIFGLGTGLSMPLVLVLLARHVAAEEQGLVGGLRATANRAASFILPLAMGLVAQLYSIPAAFWIVGAFLLATLVLTELVFRSRIH